MHPFFVRVALGSVLLCCSAAAQTPAKTPAADDFQNEALVFERYEMTYRMHADGTGERANHVLVRIQSEGAAREFSVLSFAYASANETPHIELVRVHKADGSVVDTPVADAIEMSAAVTREAPLYSDLKEKHLPVRSLSTGDTLEYDVRTTIEKAEAPGQFWGVHHFTVPGTIVAKAEVLTVEVPKDKYVQVWSPNHKAEVSEHDGLRSYRWTVAQLVPAPKAAAGEDNKAKVKAPKDPYQDADGRTLPSVAWTTFHTWAEVGEWYRGLALARAQPNDALRAKAAEITKDAKTPEEQVRAIYGFVSAGTRYVGIDFGVGRYQPHAAVEVLANQYGDCKDKDTLLEALLRAKGFKTAPALIGAGITPTPDVPSPATFNHVITTVNLPDGLIWLDSTPEVAPYRYLSANLRDQPALVVPAEGAAALEHAPEATPYPFVAKFESAGTLDKDGKLMSKVTASYRTDDELVVRSMARSVAPANWDKASQYISSNTGFSGTTSETRFSAIGDLSKPIEVEYAYTRHPYGDWDNRRIIPPFPWLELPLLGEDATEPDDDIALGTPRTLSAVGKIRLPEGYTTDLPDAVHVKTDFATFDKTYRFDGKEIVIERTVVIVKKKLPKVEWKRYQAFTRQAGLGNEPWIQLIKPVVKAETKPVTGSPGPKSDTKGPEEDPHETSDASEKDNADELMRKAGVFMREADWDNAVKVLDEVKQINLKLQHLWTSYGVIAEIRHDNDGAKADFEKEIAAHPDDPSAISVLAELENRTGDWAGARKVLSGYLASHAENAPLAIQLAQMQITKEDNDGALKTLQRTAEHNPEDRALRLQLSQTLLLLDRKDEAAAAAKSVLDGSDDTLLQNNAAYVLADAGLDLADAEAASRKSIATLEEKSAAITTEEVNSSAFAQANLLISSWDTLGWVLFREGKPQEAKPLIMAAWRNGLKPEEGDHLGQLYEAMGKKDEAYTAYSLAQGSLERGGLTPEVKKHLTESVARLKKEGAKTTGRSGREALQDSRTYKIPGSVGMSGWGTFRLQITAAGVVGSQQMSGEQKLAGMTKVLGAMKFPELVPPDSRAHLLRSGVVSCSSSTGCELVLVPNSGLQTERY